MEQNFTKIYINGKKNAMKGRRKDRLDFYAEVEA